MVSCFSPKDSVWTSTSRFQNNWFELLLCEFCLERSIESYVKKGYLHHFFMCCIIIISFRKAHVLWQQLTREERPHMESKAPSSPIPKKTKLHPRNSTKLCYTPPLLPPPPQLLRPKFKSLDSPGSWFCLS